MKNTLSTLVLGSLLSFGAQASPEAAEIVQDDHCFVISGANFDHNGALSTLVSAKRAGRKYVFAGYQCTIFGSYKELKVHLASSVQKESPIFIMQVAHGGIGGSALLDGGSHSSSQILKELRDISANYKIAFLNQACYGGTNLQDKIAWDEANSASESIDRTCMWADSLPGRVAVGLNSILRSKDPYTLEEAYTALPDGVISSAAWTEVGMSKAYHAVAQYPGYRLKEKVVISQLAPHTSKFLNGMAEVISENPFLPANSRVIMDSAKFVLSASTKDADIKSYLSLAQAGQYSFEPMRVATFNPPASDDVCTLAVRKFVQAQWYPIFRTHNNVWGLFLDKLKNDLPENKDFKENCPESEVAANESAMDWSRWLTKHSPVGVQMQNYARAYDNFQHNNPDAAKHGITMQKFVDDTFAELQISPLTKNLIFLSIIGRTILDEESAVIKMPDGSRMKSGFPNVGTEGATGNVLPAFGLASIKKENLSNTLDSRRRDACRSIQLKAW